MYSLCLCVVDKTKQTNQQQRIYKNNKWSSCSNTLTLTPNQIERRRYSHVSQNENLDKFERVCVHTSKVQIQIVKRKHTRKSLQSQNVYDIK